ncbi:MAG TPA: winged helix-turn-helix domain-containing protein [Nitrososphaera sp.]|nr:winged helix-turn-helix domain-containing protein [Nitrososphaera sp.]
MENTNPSREENGAGREEAFEILTSDDTKIKSIGAIFANDTSRQILMKIFDGVDTTSEIAASLNLSIPLVSYHLKRLEQASLIKVGHTTYGSKQQNVNHYVPYKLAFVLIPSARVVEQDRFRDAIHRGFDFLKKKLLLPAIAGTASSALLYAMLLFSNKSPRFTADVTSEPTDFTSILLSNLELATAVSVGIACAYVVYKFKKDATKN